MAQNIASGKKFDITWRVILFLVCQIYRNVSTTRFTYECQISL